MQDIFLWDTQIIHGSHRRRYHWATHSFLGLLPPFHLEGVGGHCQRPHGRWRRDTGRLIDRCRLPPIMSPSLPRSLSLSASLLLSLYSFLPLFLAPSPPLSLARALSCACARMSSHTPTCALTFSQSTRARSLFLPATLHSCSPSSPSCRQRARNTDSYHARITRRGTGSLRPIACLNIQKGYYREVSEKAT